MKKRVLILFLILFTVFVGAGFRFSEPKDIPAVAKTSLDAEKLWSLINDWRIKNGLKTFIKHQSLCNIAKVRLSDPKMDNHKGLIDRYAYKYPSVLGENLAFEFTNNEELLNSWANSPSHKKNLTDPFKYACVAVQDDYAVQIFSNCENTCP